MKGKARKFLRMVLPAVMLCSPAGASSARTFSRYRGRVVAVQSETADAVERQIGKNRDTDPFALFGTDAKPVHEEVAAAGRDVLDFLKSNGLLRATGEAVSEASGDLEIGDLGRKEFAHASPYSHCHSTWGTYNTNTTNTNPTVCVNSWNGVWHTKTTAPVFQDAWVANKTATSFDVNVDVNKSSTVYAVLVLSTAPAPGSAQVKSGVDGSGAAAVQTKSLPLTSGDFTGAISFSGLNANTKYMVYLVADSGTELTPTPESVNPAYEFGTISSAGTWKFPKVRTDSNGDFYTLYKDSAANTLRFVKWNGASWSNYATLTAGNVPGRTTVSYGNEYRANFEFDGNDNLHVIFNAGTGIMANTQDGFHGVYNGASWTVSQIANDPNPPDETRLFIDGNNKAHVVYHVDGYGVGRNYILKYATNAGGSWSSREILETVNRGTDELHDSYVVVGSSGTVTLFYRREDVQNSRQDNYYMTTSADNFAANTLILNGKGLAKQYQVGNVIIDGNDRIHYVYSNWTDSTGHYRTNASGSWVTTTLSSSNYPLAGALDITIDGTTTYILATGNSGYFFQEKVGGGSWADGHTFSLNGSFRDRFGLHSGSNRIMIVSENSSDWTISYHSGTIGGYGLTESAAATDSDGTLTAAGGVTEPVNIPTSADSGAPVGVFDFTIADGGSADGLTLDVSQINLNLSGTASGNISKLRFNLTGCASKSAVAPSGTTVSFAAAGISVADGGSINCTVQAYWNNNTGITDNQTIALRIDGDTDLTVDDSKTRMSGSNAPVATGSMATTVNAIKLVFTTQPAGSVSGIPLTTQPVVAAQDAAGNTDTDFTGVVNLTEASDGSLTNAGKAAANGVAGFTDLTYSASVDQQSFVLTADESGSLTTANANPIISDVVATQLVFTPQPAPLTVKDGVPLDFATDPIVAARNADNIIDTDFNDTVTLTETGVGTATYTNNVKPAINGIAEFTGLTITYSAGSPPETFALQANDGNDGANAEGNLPSKSSANLTAIPVNPGYWTGAVNSDWNNSANWDDVKVPSVAVDVLIRPTSHAEVTNPPMVNISDAVCRNLTIEDGATLSISAAGNILNVGGTYTKKGTGKINASNGGKAVVKGAIYKDTALRLDVGGAGGLEIKSSIDIP